MLSHTYDVIIDCGASEPGRGRELVDDLNTTEIFSLSVNGNCATDRFKRVGHIYGN